MTFNPETGLGRTTGQVRGGWGVVVGRMRDWVGKWAGKRNLNHALHHPFRFNID